MQYVSLGILLLKIWWNRISIIRLKRRYQLKKTRYKIYYIVTCKKNCNCKHQQFIRSIYLHFFMQLFRNSDMDAAEKLKSSTNIQSDGIFFLLYIKQHQGHSTNLYCKKYKWIMLWTVLQKPEGRLFILRKAYKTYSVLNMHKR